MLTSALLLCFGCYGGTSGLLTEELIFRGAVLFILLRRIGKSNALLLSAAAFGVYHWFSFGLWGNVVPMVVIFTGTGLMGYALALAYYKTESVALPVGIHLGWNFTLNTVFSKGPLGTGVMISSTALPPNTLFSLIGLIGAPLLILAGVKVLLPQKVPVGR
ncbi:CPBP family intramembrane glutamic endopeptidase [Roseivirga sp. BDSF3-8]|uniref:CPBP family intramembrane glutamic endopeptidase n=1 Tax=Roseivirga sp. BDSF3-8 TaxID=3241598 RepID=UPI003531AC10